MSINFLNSFNFVKILKKSSQITVKHSIQGSILPARHGPARVKSVPCRAGKKILKSVPCREKFFETRAVPCRAGKKPCRHGNFKLFNSKNTFKIALNEPKIGKKVIFSI